MVALLGLLAAPRAAQAGGLGSVSKCAYYSALWFAPSAAIDFGFAKLALDEASSGRSPSQATAGAEVGVASAKLILSLGLGGYKLRKLRSEGADADRDDRCAVIGATLTSAFSAALLVHGIWALTQAQAPGSSAPLEGPERPMTALTHAPVIGLTFLHRF